MQATIFERIGAYIIDLLIVGFLTSIITYAVPARENNTGDELFNLINNYKTGEISSSEYYKEYQDIVYKSNKEGVSETALGLVITIAYFAIFEYLNKGKTIGKLALGLKTVTKDNREPKFINILLRSLVPFGILTTTINLILINSVKKAIYLKVYPIVGLFETMFILVTIVLIAKKRDGLHDLLAGTKVIKEERRWFNAWIYWSRINSPW